MPSDTVIILDVRQLDVLARRYDGADKIIEDELLKVGRWAALAVEALAKRYLQLADAIDTGNLINSIAGEARPIAGGVEAIAGTSVPYAEAVEEGRKAGAPMPPPGSLLAWMRAHDIPDAAEFVIRRAIARRGIPARPYLTRALEELRPKVSREFAEVPGRVLKRLAVTP